MKPIVIAGAGGHGREVAQLIRDINKVNPLTWDIIGFYEENKSCCEAQKIDEIAVLGYEELTRIYNSVEKLYVVSAIGNPQVRSSVADRLLAKFQHLQFAALIHPTAVIGYNTVIGSGSMVCAYTVITTNVVLGNHVLVNYGSTVGHDSRLDDYATVLPGGRISGNVKLDPLVSIGAGAIVLPGVHVGIQSTVGAGAVVTKNLPGNCTAVGVPAKIIKQNGQKING